MEEEEAFSMVTPVFPPLATAGAELAATAAPSWSADFRDVSQPAAMAEMVTQVVVGEVAAEV